MASRESPDASLDLSQASSMTRTLVRVSDGTARGGGGERGADLFGGREDRVAREGEGVERAVGGLGVAGSTGVGDDDRDVAEVGGVTDGGLDADLERDS